MSTEGCNLPQATSSTSNDAASNVLSSGNMISGIPKNDVSKIEAKNDTNKKSTAATNGNRKFFKRWSSADIDAQITAASAAIAYDGEVIYCT